MFSHILVDVDAFAAAHPALERAITLAQQAKAKLTIVDVQTIPPGIDRILPEGSDEAITAQREAKLASFVTLATGIEADHKVLSGRPAEAIAQEVIRGGHDLVVRAHQRDLAADEHGPLGAIDRDLFRLCPCPVLAVGPRATYAPKHVLAAVHANPEDDHEQTLNRRILEMAAEVARLSGASLTVLQAWHAWGEDLLRGHAKDGEVDEYVSTAETTATKDLRALVSSIGGEIARARLEVREGQPEDVIPRFAVDQAVDMVVMGTMARRGLAGFVLGNTAERMLTRLGCSVLAIKPEEFESPVQP